MTIHVISLVAENYKRLKAVEIRPSSSVVTVSGRNAAGKSSVLDAIWAAFAGGEASRATQQPIRDGEDTAFVTVDLGEYIVTRRWTKDDAGTLTVQAKDGARYGSPQKLLDELLGRRSFDPYAFINLDAKKQVGVLLDILGDDLTIDPATVDAERRGVFETRTETGRDVKKLEGQLAGYSSADPSLPDAEVSAADLLAQAEQAREHNAQRDRVIDMLSRAEQEAARAEAEFTRAKRALDDAHAALTVQRTAVEQMPAAVDTTAIGDKLATLEQTNARIRQEQHRKAIAEELSDRRQEVAQLTLKLREIDDRKAAALATATAKLPVPGISIDESGLTFNGIPFSQASHAEQLRVATALSMAFHPELRVLRIDNGESLDAESLRIIEELAAEHEYQVWLAKVSDEPGAGIFIEEGQVRS